MVNLVKNKQKIKVKSIKTVNNPNSVHGIFPYRGKISAIDATNVVSQLQLNKKNGVLFDPFCGSGTILYEGFKQGMSVIGMDNNPLAIWLSKGKMDLARKKRIMTISK